MGSQSRDQWQRINEDQNQVYISDDNDATSSDPLSSFRATKELDFALKHAPESEPSEATAVTGNISGSGHRSSNSVTPDRSHDDRGRKNRGSGGDRRRSRSGHKSATRPKLIMCGAIDVSEEMRGSIQDANASLRQIFSTVRRFGPEEKEAVKETVRDAKNTLTKTIRSAVSCRGK